MGEKRRRNGTLITQGGLMSAFSIGIAMLLLLRQIPITNMIGDEGNGYYCGVYEFYTVLLFLTAYSLPDAMGRLIALRVNRGQYKNARQVFKAGFLLCVVAGLLLGGIQFLFSKGIAEQIVGLPYGRLALQCLAPALLFTLIASAFRGYFQGMGSLMPTSVSKLLAAVIQFVMCLVMGYMVFSYGAKASVVLNEPSYGPAFGAAGVSVGIAVGELFSLAFLNLLYCAYNRNFKKQVLRDTTKNTENVSQLFGLLGMTMLPFLVNGLLLHCNVLLNQIIYNHGLAAKEQALLATEFGIYYGKYHILTGIPIAILTVMAGNFLNIYSKLIARGNDYHSRRLFIDGIKQILAVSGISTLLLMLLAGPLVEILYKGDSVTAIKMLRMGSIAVVFYGLALLTGAALQGRGKIWFSTISILAGLLVQSILLKVLIEVTELGIYSVVIANIVFPLVIFAGNLLFLNKCQE
ncbi:MAG: oligosaccharide flippase family protein [Roseburia sp.]|nr:oligosaccharide flippase family protein [Roseburia sp.]MCM1279220.1 oligosaccharide flippase family protein [Robinsoniella sp.]